MTTAYTTARNQLNVQLELDGSVWTGLFDSRDIDRYAGSNETLLVEEFGQAKVDELFPDGGGSKLLLHYFNSVCVGRVRGMREMRGTRAAWCARGGRAAAAVQRRSGAGERRWRGAARCGAGGGVARGTSGAARTKGLLAKGFLFG